MHREQARLLLSLVPLLALLATLTPTTGVGAQEIEEGRFDTLIDAGRRAWEIPGVAVAIVRGDAAVVAKGYGKQAVDSTDPVDGHTLFAIGSTTKAFTATALGMLVDKGRLDWDDRVADVLPGFALRDPYTTREITIRDLLAHRSGLPMANLMWLGGQHDRSELVRRIRHLEPTAGFRSAFSYQNVLYTASGQALEAVAGTSWDAFLAERIFGPLGMERTTTSVGPLARLGNVATPHVPIDGAPRPVPYRDIAHVGPAGSIHSTAADMARWLRLQLGGGTFDDRRLLGEATLAETHRSQIVIRREGPFSVLYPTAHSLAYGMGWVVSDYQGRRLLDHSGGIDGMTALVALMPEERLGVAILANLQLPLPPYGMLYSILDACLGREATDWDAKILELAEQVAQRPAADRVAGTKPSLMLERYAGSYESELLGEILVEPHDGGLRLRYGRLAGPIEHWHYDTFRVSWTDVAWLAAAGPAWVTFRLDRAGTVEGIRLEVAPGETWTLDRSQHGQSQPQARARGFSSDQGAEPQAYRSISRIGNTELAEMTRSQRGSTLATGC